MLKPKDFARDALFSEIVEAAKNGSDFTDLKMSPDFKHKWMNDSDPDFIGVIRECCNQVQKVLLKEGAYLQQGFIACTQMYPCSPLHEAAKCNHVETA
jgi:hypothetical protein